MLDTENKTFRFINKCIKDCPFVFLVRPCDPGNGNIRIVMMEISETQEESLNAGKSLSLIRGGLSFSIDPDFCLAWGELDLSPNSEDINSIDNSNWFARLYVRQFMPSEYDYEHHCVMSNSSSRGKYFDTDNIKIYLPYLYACINKPKRVVIFKEYKDIIGLERAKAKRERDIRNFNKHKEEYKQRAKERRAAKRATKINMLSFNIKH